MTDCCSGHFGLERSTVNLALNLRAWSDVSDIFNVGFNGCCIGRLWLARDRSEAEKPWEWMISIPMALPDSSKGIAESFDTAVRAIAMAWGQIIVTTPPSRLESALALLRATGIVVVDKEEGAREASPTESRSQGSPDQTQINHRAALPPTPTQNAAAAPNYTQARLARMSPTNVKIEFGVRAKQASQSNAGATAIQAKPAATTMAKTAAVQAAGSNGAASSPAPNMPAPRPANVPRDAASIDNVAHDPEPESPTQRGGKWTNLA
jgi:hypothetical protein